MSMFPPFRKGSWWIRSESDPRWNVSGSSDAVGSYTKPREVDPAIEQKKRELGEEPPSDLEWGYMKD